MNFLRSYHHFVSKLRTQCPQKSEHFTYCKKLTERNLQHYFVTRNLSSKRAQRCNGLFLKSTTRSSNNCWSHNKTQQNRLSSMNSANIFRIARFHTENKSGAAVESLDLLKDLIAKRKERQSVVTLYQRRVRLSNVQTYEEARIESKNIDNSTKTIEMTGKLASRFCEVYLALPQFSVSSSESSSERINIINAINCVCKIDENRIESTVRQYLDQTDARSSSKENKLSPKLLREMRDACTPVYEGFFQLILTEADWKIGMKFIVEFRKDLITCLDALRMLNESKENERWKQLKQMDTDLKSLIAVWFSAGLLGKCIFFATLSLDNGLKNEKN